MLNRHFDSLVYAEGQHIKTNQQNILIRSLTLKKQRGDSSSKDGSDGSRKRYCSHLLWKSDISSVWYESYDPFTKFPIIFWHFLSFGENLWDNFLLQLGYLWIRYGICLSFVIFFYLGPFLLSPISSNFLSGMLKRVWKEHQPRKQITK